MLVAGGVGLWMFYVQHQFEDGYWTDDPNWDHTAAAMDGSSFYKLPKILQWFSGNIGFHHIHHLNSRIPNYNLERCHNSDPRFVPAKPVTFWKSFKTLRLRLWDEEQRTMVGYSALRRYRNRAA
jgi:omega-6 fatty acid desaturase (delta-12 desaturase)